MTLLRVLPEKRPSLPTKLYSPNNRITPPSRLHIGLEYIFPSSKTSLSLSLSLSAATLEKAIRKTDQQTYPRRNKNLREQRYIEYEKGEENFGLGTPHTIIPRKKQLAPAPNKLSTKKERAALLSLPLANFTSCHHRVRIYKYTTLQIKSSAAAHRVILFRTRGVCTYDVYIHTHALSSAREV